MLTGHLHISSLEKCLFKSFAHFWIRFLLLLNFRSSLYIQILISYQINDLQIFPPIMCVVSFYSGDRASLVAQVVKTLLEMQETQVQSLGWEDLLKKEMATHCSILAWKIPQTEEPGGVQSIGSQRVGLNRATNTLWMVSFDKKTFFKFSWSPICLLFLLSTNCAFGVISKKSLPKPMLWRVLPCAFFLRVFVLGLTVRSKLVFYTVLIKVQLHSFVEKIVCRSRSNS